MCPTHTHRHIHTHEMLGCLSLVSWPGGWGDKIDTKSGWTGGPFTDNDDAERRETEERSKMQERKKAKQNRKQTPQKAAKKGGDFALLHLSA